MSASATLPERWACRPASSSKVSKMPKNAPRSQLRLRASEYGSIHRGPTMASVARRLSRRQSDGARVNTAVERNQETIGRHIPSWKWAPPTGSGSPPARRSGGPPPARVGVGLRRRAPPVPRRPARSSSRRQDRAVGWTERYRGQAMVASVSSQSTTRSASPGPTRLSSFGYWSACLSSSSRRGDTRNSNSPCSQARTAWAPVGP